jgi:hypothetical protein
VNEYRPTLRHVARPGRVHGHWAAKGLTHAHIAAWSGHWSTRGCG